MKIRNYSYLFFILGFLVLFASCEYDYIEKDPGIDPNDTISFSAQVVPVFESNSCTGCHNDSGSPQLDLTAENAYNSLTSLGMVDTIAPESSKIYTYPHPVSGDHLPYSSLDEAEIILQWIKQGALDN
ncbi:MAG: hypothetical protein K8R53_09375 [Bacteroidales bacterium]|nr:hypothetical protein [Bacteroidales bacterium]